MLRLSRGRARFGWLAGLALLLTPHLGHAQPASQEVRFESADKVKIKGTFYPSGGGNKSPCVILLHKLGGNRQQEGWDDLAKDLQRKGFAVLSFDFRGHGDSTAVEPDVFMSIPLHKKMFKSSKQAPRDRITTADFVNHKKNASYTPMLANDIQAAKYYLDQRNDAGDCNSSNLILIGAEEGAALGALWAAIQYNSPHYMANPFGVGIVRDPRRVEGENLSAAVWLSPPTQLARTGSVQTYLSRVRDKLPMMLVYGDKDEATAKSTNYLAKGLKGGSRGAEQIKILKKPSKAAGQELLKKSLGTSDEICNYLEKALEKRGNIAWEKHVNPPIQLLTLSQYFPGLP